MNATFFTTKPYENNPALRLRQYKPNTNPSKPNLAEAKMSANTYFTRNYENEPFWSLPENKPNQTQFVKRPERNATTVLTEDYENQPPWGSKSNQTQFPRASI